MKWPFVSRETLDEAHSRISALERQVAELTLERKQQLDFIMLRAQGVTAPMSLFGMIQAPAESFEPEEPEPAPQVNDDGSPKEMPQPSKIGRARTLSRRVESENLARYTKDQQHVMDLINNAKEEGRNAALATPTNGNGNHSS